MSSKIPRGETKKNIQDSKDTATAAHPVVKSDGIFKGQKEHVPRKNVAPKVKGTSTRYGQQMELKEQNQQLLAANSELQNNLLESRQKATELELSLGELQKENVEMQKNLHNCHVLLVSAKIDPVLGERVGEEAQQTEDKRKEVVSVSTDLLMELKAFGDFASRQRSRLEEIRTTMKDVAEAQETMKREKANFLLEAAEMEEALKRAEVLLL